MKKVIALLMTTAIVASAGFIDLGLGATVMTEAESSADYGWTGTVSSGVNLLNVDLSTMLMGTVWYPDYTHHAGISGTVLGVVGLPLDSEMGMELGGGVVFRNEYARTAEDEEVIPVVYYAWNFDLASGHNIRPFVMAHVGADRETFQSGFIVSFGR